MRLGGGLLVALAAGAAGAGYWLLAAVVAAALLGGFSTGLPEPGETVAERGVIAFARFAEVAVYALAFGYYIFPAQPRVAAALFVLAVAGAGFAGLRLPAAVTRWLTASLLIAGLALVAVCVAVPPVATANVTIGAPDAAGLVVAALVVFPFLRPAGKTQAGWRVLLVGSAAALITFAALYQLGPVRLGLSVTSLRDLLAAADADSLQGLLTVAVVLATAGPALAACAEIRERAGKTTVAAGGLAAAAVLVAAGVTALAVLVPAGLGAVIELLLRVRARRYSGVRE